MYMQDYDDKIHELIPGGAANMAGEVGEPSMWMGVLQPYIKNVDVFLCASSVIPKVEITFARRMTASIGMNAYMGWYFNYFYWAILPPGEAKEKDPRYPRPVSDAQIQYPSITAIFTDGFDRVNALGQTPRGYYADPGNGKGVRFGISDRHTAGSNLVLIDGHAQWYKTNSVLSQKAIDTPDNEDGLYIEMTNYNAAGIIWDVDAPNQFTAPNKWPTACCND
jgi:hypothetical protein